MKLSEIITMPPIEDDWSRGMTGWAWHDSILNSHPTEKLELIPGMESAIVTVPNGLRVFVIVPHKPVPKPVVYLQLSEFLDGYRVSVIKVEPQARGQGLGAKLYAGLVDHLKKPLYSDTTQTDASRVGIWNKLLKQFPNRIVGYDQRTKEELPLSISRRGPAVREKEPIYTPKKGPEDRPLHTEPQNRTRLLKLLPSTVSESNTNTVTNLKNMASLVAADQADIDEAIEENFADGKGPGRPGDSRRHGIPKNATLAQLDKIGKGSGRKAQLARWQANMRRGKAKSK